MNVADEVEPHEMLGQAAAQQFRVMLFRTRDLLVSQRA